MNEAKRKSMLAIGELENGVTLDLTGKWRVLLQPLHSHDAWCLFQRWRWCWKELWWKESAEWKQRAALEGSTERSPRAMLSGVEYCYFLFHGDNSIFCKALRSEESAKSMFGRNMAEGGFPCGSVVKNLPANAGDAGLNLGKITWRRKWQSSPAFLPGKSHGEKCLVGCSPWGSPNSRTWLSDRLSFYGKILKWHWIVWRWWGIGLAVIGDR